MLTNTAVTILNQRKDPTTKVITYLKTVLGAVHWEPRKAVSISTNGVSMALDTSSDKVLVFIPFTVRATATGAGSDDAKTYVDPNAFSAAAGAAQAGQWTLTPGRDYIVKGIVAGDSSPLSEAQAKDIVNGAVEAYLISNVDTFAMGGERMQHWEVGGR